MPLPMEPGVLGMARTSRARAPHPERRKPVVMPAAIERTRAPVLPRDERSAVSPLITWGFSARTAAASLGRREGSRSLWSFIFFARASALRALEGVGSTTWIDEKLLEAIQPLSSAP